MTNREKLYEVFGYEVDKYICDKCKKCDYWDREYNNMEYEKLISGALEEVLCSEIDKRMKEIQVAVEAYNKKENVEGNNFDKFG